MPAGLGQPFSHLSLLSYLHILSERNHLPQVHFSTSYLKSRPCFPSRLKPQIEVGTQGYPPKAYITGFRISLGQCKRSAPEPANLGWHRFLPHSQSEDLSQSHRKLSFPTWATKAQEELKEISKEIRIARPVVWRQSDLPRH